MAFSIVSVSPAEGITPGKDRILIEGTDFDQHPFPPVIAGYIGNSLGASLRVSLGGIEAKNVIVYDKPGGAPGETIIECSTPRYIGDPTALPADVDLVVENLLVPATATLAGGFKYRRPEAISNSGLTLVVYALLRELVRQTPIPPANIVQRVHTDYDESSADLLNLVKIAGTPTLLVHGPKLSKAEGVYNNYNTIRDTTGNVDGSGFRSFRQTRPRDLTFDLTLIDENGGRALNLVDMLDRFVQDNGTLKVEKVPGSPVSGFFEFDLDWGELFEIDQAANRDNLLSASSTLIVRGVVLERLGNVEIDRALLTDDQGVILDSVKKE